MQTATTSHLFLQKPCDPGELDRVIASALSIRSLLGIPELQAVVAQMGVLPSAPRLYVQLMGELSRDEPSIRRAAQIVASDPGTAAKLLQLVNSAYFGYFGKVTSLERAVAILGFATLRAVVLSMKSFAMIESAKAPWFDHRFLAHHSLTVGQFARTIAPHIGHASSQEVAFVSGLLHDVGKAVFASKFRDRYLRVWMAAGTSPWRIAEIERAEFGASHAEVGAYLMALWGLDDEVVRTIARHHGTAGDPCVAADLVRIADAMAHEADGGQVDREMLTEACALLGSDYDTLRELCSRIEGIRESAA